MICFNVLFSFSSAVSGSSLDCDEEEEMISTSARPGSELCTVPPCVLFGILGEPEDALEAEEGTLQYPPSKFELALDALSIGAS